MALYPEVQKKAQAEIDSVVGPNRLPNFEDRPSLPYINAVVKESMRWHVPAPLGAFYRHECYVTSWLGLKLCLTWLLTTMNMMATIFPKGQLFLVMHGQYEQLLLLSVLTFLVQVHIARPWIIFQPHGIPAWTVSERWTAQIWLLGRKLCGFWIWTPVSFDLNIFYDVHLMNYLP